MKSTAADVWVIVGTVPAGHFPPEIAPVNAPAEDCVILSVILAVPDAGWVNVRAQVEAVVRRTFCLFPFAAAMVLAVVQVPLSNSAGM